MKLTERMINDSKEQQKKLDKKRAQYFYDDLNGTETGMTYEERPKFSFINSSKSAFDTPDEKSINTAKSIFDKTAIFHTQQG